MDNSLVIIFTIIGTLAVVGIVKSFFYYASVTPPPPEGKNIKELLKEKEEANKKLREEASKAKAEKEMEEFLKANTDKYFFRVKTKDGSVYNSDEFQSTAFLNHNYCGSYGSEKYYFCYSLSAKDAATYAMNSYSSNNHYHYTPPSGFLKVGAIEVNVNEIVTKEVVKV